MQLLSFNHYCAITNNHYCAITNNHCCAITNYHYCAITNLITIVHTFNHYLILYTWQLRRMSGTNFIVMGQRLDSPTNDCPVHFAMNHEH